MSQARLLRLGLRLTQREQQALELEAQRRALAAQMNALRNQPITHPLPPPANLPQLPSLPPAEQLSATLVREHPQLAGLQALQEAAEHSEELARWNYRPNVRVQLQYLQTLPREENRTQIGLSLNVPIGQEKRDGALRAARAQRFASELAAQDARAQLQAELDAVLAQDRALERSVILLQDSALPLAEDALQAARAGFMSGQGDLQAVLDAEADRITVVLDVARSRAQHCQQRFALAQLTAGQWDGQLWDAQTMERQP
jgi:outer membrane protein TolC